MKSKRPSRFTAGLICLLTVVFASARNPDLSAMASKPDRPETFDTRFEGLVRAPEFPSGLQWLNTEKPLSIKGLHGKIVLLDFWTYCCINCMHVIPDLKKLEEKYGQELVVIGVHSAKFENEKNTDSIRQAVMRYEIKHPVVNDSEMEVWQQYGVHAWPTLVLINPNGRIIAAQSGEDVFDLFDGLIAETIRYFDAKGQLKRGPVEFALEKEAQDKTLLSFPGKIHADPVSKKLFISDSNHNRILIADAGGNILDAIGNGAEGAKDGRFENAEFNHPQGMFADGDLLYIADTENHLVRRADLKTREVTTVLGTGKKAGYIEGLRGRGTDVPLNSPWDLLVLNGKLYIAMAGSHQLWKADLETWDAEPFAGSGAEARVDGPLLSSALAQPSGITTDGSKLYFADSEVSSVRAADLNPAGNVETLIGEDLFEFGDIDGGRETARLQHALGVAWDGMYLITADTYNSKIKIIAPGSKTSKTYAGTGEHGLKDGSLSEAQFYEPGGAAVLDGKIYVADTNNHQIRVIDRGAGTVSTLELKGMEKLAKHLLKDFHGRLVKLREKKIREGKTFLNVTFELPKGYEFTHNAPIHVDVKSDGKMIVYVSGDAKIIDKERRELPFQIPLMVKPGENTLTLDGVFYYCRKDSSICLFDQVRYELPLKASPSGRSETQITIDISPKDRK